MRTFVFTVNEQKKIGANRFCRIYELINNKPTEVCRCEYLTASCRGSVSEVFNCLIDNNIISKDLYDCSKSEWRSGGYYCKGVVDRGVQIFEL